MERGKRQLASLFGSTGFYIALLLCVLAGGVGGYFWLFGGDGGEEESPLPQVTPVDQPQVQPAEDDKEEIQQVQRPVTVIMPEAQTDGDPPAEEPAPAEAAAASDEIVAPLAGETVSAFSPDMPQYNATTDDWRVHAGVDIQADAGTEVVAACAGTVLSAGADDRLGTTVVIGHADGYETTYAGLQEELAVAEGDRVSAGDPIGAVGNTTLTESALGAHLHFAVTRNGAPVDPADYLAG